MSTEANSVVDCDIDPAIQALLPNYIRRRESDVETIELLLKRSDFKEIRRLAHNMRGSGKAYGFAKITDLGALMEEAALAADVELLTDLAQKLAVLVKEMRG